MFNLSGVHPVGIIGIAIAGALILPLIGGFFGLLYRGFDRKLAAQMQGRVGPPVVQPFRDVGKLFMKESIIPEGAVSWLFTAAPFLALLASAAILLYLPVFGQQALLSNYGDAILVLYLLIIPSLAMVLGGFASSSPYATVGAQREMVIMMSYEFPLAVAIISLAWRIGQVTTANPFMLSTMAQYPIWNIVGPVGAIGVVLLLGTLMFVTPGEAAKVPFDIAEAETEIAGGILIEYSGRNLAMFYMADMLKAFIMAAIVVALFIPYNLSPLFGLGQPVLAGIVDALFFLVKTFVVMFISITLLRVAVARFKISQASSIYFVTTTAIGLFGLLLLWIDMIIM